MHDLDYMRRALELAAQGTALASPGALVGAVVVRNDKVVGEGFYTYDGVSHAEIRALNQAGDAARDSTVYLSLEPCSHHGRTPPCAAALIKAGVKRVVTAMHDPNPVVNGRGLAMLQAAGIQTETGILEQDARRLNEAHIVYKTRRRPFGILKMAMTLDGKIATRTRSSRWITSEYSRTLVQQLRHSVDAIVTGSGTFLEDLPQLTDRTGLPRRRELLRVVLDRRGRVEGTPGFTIFRESLENLVADLYSREIQSFMLECGPDLAFNALSSGVIDKIVAFVAPKILGGREVPVIGGEGFDTLADALRLRDMTAEVAGGDIVITAYLDHGETGPLPAAPRFR